MNATTWLNKADSESVLEAVRKAERETRCEFVCAVSTRSAAYPSAAFPFALLGSVGGLLLGASVAGAGKEAGSWDYVQSLPMTESLLGLILGFIVATVLARRFPLVRPPLVSLKEQRSSVNRAAAFLFGLHKVSHTDERVGVLLYLSLQERKFVVVADRAVRQALSSDDLQDITNAATAELVAGHRGQAFVKALELAVAKLKERFPYVEGDRNELDDQVLRIHPHP